MTKDRAALVRKAWKDLQRSKRRENQSLRYWRRAMDSVAEAEKLGKAAKS